MKFVAGILFVCISVLFAGIHANAINEGRGYKLKKWAHTLLYFGLAVLISWLSGWQKDGFDWVMLLNAFLIRVVFFNIPLNRMRKPPLPYFYITHELKNVNGLWDAIAKQRFFGWIVYGVFGKNQWIMYVLCFIGSVILTIKR